ncbi:hypothetical protein AZZ81_002259, partial [Klebsiella aerogenes]
IDRVNSTRNFAPLSGAVGGINFFRLIL